MSAARMAVEMADTMGVMKVVVMAGVKAALKVELTAVTTVA